MSLDLLYRNSFDSLEDYILNLVRKTKLKAYYKLWGLTGTKKQGHTKESIAPFITAIKRKFPEAGAPDIQKKLRLLYEIKASK